MDKIPRIETHESYSALKTGFIDTGQHILNTVDINEEYHSNLRTSILVGFIKSGHGKMISLY